MEDKQGEAISNVLDQFPSDAKSVVAQDIDDAKSTFFDNSDMLNMQLQQKQMQMRMQADMRTQILGNPNMSVLDQGGYPYINSSSAQHLELKKLLLNPDTENQLFYKINEDTYNKFRQTIRDREAFHKEAFAKETK